MRQCNNKWCWLAQFPVLLKTSSIQPGLYGVMLLTILLQINLNTFVSKSLLKGQVFLTLVQMWGT